MLGLFPPPEKLEKNEKKKENLFFFCPILMRKRENVCREMLTHAGRRVRDGARPKWREEEQIRAQPRVQSLQTTPFPISLSLFLNKQDTRNNCPYLSPLLFEKRKGKSSPAV
jgi:hypothetical protein